MKRGSGITERYMFGFDMVVYQRAKRLSVKLLGKDNKIPDIIRSIINKGLDEKELGLPSIVEDVDPELRDIIQKQLNRTKLMA